MPTDSLSAAAQVREDLDKATSLVLTARRLLATGTMVDLSALEGKVRLICERLAAMDRDEGRPLLPTMEKLIDDLDSLADDIHERVEPPFPLEPGPSGPSGHVP